MSKQYCVVAVEDTNGETIGAFKLEINNKNGVIVWDMSGDISLADIDGDDIFDTPYPKLRIQLEK